MDHVGRIIGGRYELIEQLGEGGMGAVFRALDRQSRRTVACKLLQPEVAQDPMQVDRFRREFAVLKEIEHPSLVRLIDGVFTSEEPFLVFEIVEGRSLEAELAGAPIALHQALVFAMQLADAVGVLHAHQVIHRDLKPTNVMVRPDGSICLLDFGIAKHYGDAARTLDRITSEGYVVGTPQYMPPEGLFGGAVTPAYDVWSLGVMFYEMITGQRPFAAFEHSVPELASALMAGGFKPASHLTPSLPKVVDACIERFLEARPERRPADGAEARAALRELDAQTLALRTRGSSSGTVQMPQASSGRFERPSRKNAAPDPAGAVRRRMSAPTPAPGRRAKVAAVAGAALLVLGGLITGLKPVVQPVASPSPVVTGPSESPAADVSPVQAARQLLHQIAEQPAPAPLDTWLARTMRVKLLMTPAERDAANARLQSLLAAGPVAEPLRRLLSGPIDAAAVLDTPDDRIDWARVSWFSVVEHLADTCKLKVPYPRRLAAAVDRYWPPVSEDMPVDGTWKNLIFRAVAKRVDVRFGVEKAGLQRPVSYTFKFKLAKAASAARVWFGSKNMDPEHALVVCLNRRAPLVMRPLSGPTTRSWIPLRFELLTGTEGGIQSGLTFRALDNGDGPDYPRVYFGRDVPASYLQAGDNDMEVSCIDLRDPGASVVERPSTWLKIVSYK